MYPAYPESAAQIRHEASKEAFIRLRFSRVLHQILKDPSNTPTAQSRQIAKKVVTILNSLARRDTPVSKLPQLECGAWLGDDIRAELMTPRPSCESHEASRHKYTLPAATPASAAGL